MATVIALDHVNVAMPAGREEEADGFYSGLLGFEILEKPAAQALRGGRWFRRGDVQVHLGVDPDFRPALTAHPALRVAGLDELAPLLEAAGVPLHWDDTPEVHRCVVFDPFGNRVELIDG
ncbi:MAG TPA: VOC family protein [Acidimicrobiales bacterium]|nr:VOC family protein [Acidimicrobiales bacterium]